MKKKFGQEPSPTSSSGLPSALPSGRNAGQKNYLSIPQNCVPGAGSPRPTQASKSARGKIGNM